MEEPRDNPDLVYVRDRLLKLAQSCKYATSEHGPWKSKETLTVIAEHLTAAAEEVSKEIENQRRLLPPDLIRIGELFFRTSLTVGAMYIILDARAPSLSQHQTRTVMQDLSCLEKLLIDLAHDQRSKTVFGFVGRVREQIVVRAHETDLAHQAAIEDSDL